MPSSEPPAPVAPPAAAEGGHGPFGIAFLLAQLGADAATRFARRLDEVGLTAAEGAILRLVAADSGRSQQSLAEALGLLPSRMVAFVDDLERRGLVMRGRNPEDRRRHALSLTAEGRRVLQAVGRAGAAHEKETTSTLTQPERDQLLLLLRRLADAQGLRRGVHPGFRTMGGPTRPDRG